VHVIATAGHVDHGKSTLVRALTGMEPDRWAEERRRGLTIGLGFAWTTIGGVELAFVDVPGHERFVTTMLAGVGPVPAVLFAVAADEGWMPQSTEHLAVLDALGVRHGLLVITRADRADPSAAQAEALERLARTSLGRVPPVAVSAVTGLGMDQLRASLVRLAGELPAPDPDADVRLWIDRAFTIEGAGTVVTGTLAAGTIAAGDELCLSSGARVQVRGVQSLGRPVGSVAAVARVAVNLRGVEKSGVRAGDTLLTPDAWITTDLIDVRLRPGELPAHLVLHLGSAATGVHVRPLGTTSARLRLSSPLPLRVGDRVVLRDPGRHEIAAGADVLDLDPPPLRRRGSARRRGEDLDTAADLTALQLREHGFLRPERFRMLGLPAPEQPVIAGWHVDPALADRLTADLKSEVDSWRAENPLRPDVPLEMLRQRLGVPSVELTRQLAGRAGVRTEAARALPDPVAWAVETLVRELRAAPFRAPEAERLRELGLGTRELAAAVRTGALVRVADGVVLVPGAFERAAEILGEFGRPFTLSEARQALDTTRRVAVPLMERLDALGVTRRAADGTRTLRTER
jgi:selenocysteine-specific elongation factor